MGVVRSKGKLPIAEAEAGRKFHNFNVRAKFNVLVEADSLQDAEEKLGTLVMDVGGGGVYSVESSIVSSSYIGPFAQGNPKPPAKVATSTGQATFKKAALTVEKPKKSKKKAGGK